MTTIATINGEIAADSQVTRGNMIDGLNRTKLYRFADFWAGFCGDTHDISILCAYLKEDTDNLPTDLDCEGLILPDKGKPRTFRVSNGSLITEEVDDGYAVGSGAAYARAAMEVGASAKDAVKAAIKFDVFSGGRVMVRKRGDLK